MRLQPHHSSLNKTSPVFTTAPHLSLRLPGSLIGNFPPPRPQLPWEGGGEGRKGRMKYAEKIGAENETDLMREMTRRDKSCR